jgi:polar amino acid transport system substrate-binding protein
MTRSRVFIAAALSTFVSCSAAFAVELPDAIRKAGVLHLSVNATYAPMEYHDPATNQLIGLDVELGEALGKRLGVKVEWTDVAFAELIPSLATGRTDFIISGLSDRATRRETMDFIDYLRTGAQFFVMADSPAKEPADLCGKKVGTTRSTSFPGDIEAWSKKVCEAAGKPAVQYVPGENSIDVRNQMKQGRIDAAVQGSETLPYAMENETGKYRIVGAPFTLGYQGIAFRKTDTDLREAVMSAFGALIADGSYAAILSKHGLGANALAAPLVNASPL